MSWTARRVLGAVRGELLVGSPETAFAAISTDTRSLPPGALFVPLVGETYDGHEFLAAAAEAGAGGVLLEAGRAGELAVPGGLVVIAVEDTLAALGDLAATARREWGGTVIGLTGSNGKSTSKEMCAAILAAAGKAVLKNEGNYNNLVGLPLTLLLLEPAHEIAVSEMGTNAPGEIARLAEIARPDVGAVLNVGRAHLEGFGGLDAVASEKGALLGALADDGVAVANADDPRVMRHTHGIAAQVKTFGRCDGCDVRVHDPVAVSEAGTRFDLEIEGVRVEVRLPLIGMHQAMNAAAAAAMATAAGADADAVVRGLSGLAPLGRRMRLDSIAGLRIIDDAYNANPTSVRAALEALAALRGGKRSFVVLGEMLELGRESATEHRDVGRAAVGSGVDCLIALERATEVAAGAREAGLAAEACLEAETPEQAAEWILEHSEPGDWLLVKGSRGARTERVLAALAALETEET